MNQNMLPLQSKIVRHDVKLSNIATLRNRRYILQCCQSSMKVNSNGNVDYSENLYFLPVPSVLNDGELRKTSVKKIRNEFLDALMANIA